jgi:hypothetical protein
MPTSLREEYAYWQQLLGGLAGSVSIISLIQKLFAIGLTPLLAKFLDYYRGIFYPLIDKLLFFVPFHIPSWYKDLYCLSFVILVAVYRNTDHRRDDHLHAAVSRALDPNGLPFQGSPKPSLLLKAVVVPVVAALHSVILFGFFMVPDIIERLRATPLTEAARIHYNEAFGAAVSLVAAVCAVVVFFLLNATL